jgi:hypothetical protein
MSGQIFISYRREDSWGVAGRLSDRLRAQFGRNQIFMDLHSIELGGNFMEVIETTVAKCDVLLAVIGNNWLTTKDEYGDRRLDNPADWVRKEIGTALQRQIRVIPILVGSALMPRSTDLLEDLKPLVSLNVLRLTSDSFEGDLQRLAAAIRQVLEKAADEQRQRGEKERLKAEREEKERREKERLAVEERQREEKEGLEAERRQRLDSAAEWLAEAQRYLDAKDFAKAVPLVQKAADGGNADAMHSLGWLYEQGYDVVIQDYGQGTRVVSKGGRRGQRDRHGQLGLSVRGGSGRPSGFRQGARVVPKGGRCWRRTRQAGGPAGVPAKFWSTVKRIFKS